MAIPDFHAMFWYVLTIKRMEIHLDLAMEKKWKPRKTKEIHRCSLLKVISVFGCLKKSVIHAQPVSVCERENIIIGFFNHEMLRVIFFPLNMFRQSHIAVECCRDMGSQWVTSCWPLAVSIPKRATQIHKDNMWSAHEPYTCSICICSIYWSILSYFSSLLENSGLLLGSPQPHVRTCEPNIPNSPAS